MGREKKNLSKKRREWKTKNHYIPENWKVWNIGGTRV
jgi:hypothetical protein